MQRKKKCTKISVQTKAPNIMQAILKPYQKGQKFPLSLSEVFHASPYYGIFNKGKKGKSG